ncbi:MAG TPA: ROK family transcriptional regulator [Fervidobacterium nodosum]|nr:ROK family transcriptional regulator [Fervidobacterium nodosum]
MKNEAKILLQILRNKTIRRKELEEIIDVTPSTMTYLLDKLKGYIEIEEGDTNLGKPPQFISLSKDAWKVLSISVGREKIRAILYNAKGEELERSEYRVKHENLSNDGITSLVKNIIDKFYDYDSIGIAFSGNVVEDKVYSTILKLDKYDPVKSLKLKKLGIPYVIISDVEAIAAYESKTTGNDKVFVLNYGTGIGACYYEYHALFTRDEFKVIPLGHIYLNGEEKCYCGAKGCLETVASDYVAVKNYLGQNIDFVHFIENEETFWEELKDVRNLYKQNEEVAERVYSQIIDNLAFVVGNISMILGLDEITLYGEGTSTWFANKLEKRINELSKNFNVRVRHGKVMDVVERGTSLEAAVAFVRKKFSK